MAAGEFVRCIPLLVVTLDLGIDLGNTVGEPSNNSWQVESALAAESREWLKMCSHSCTDYVRTSIMPTATTTKEVIVRINEITANTVLMFPGGFPHRPMT